MTISLSTAENKDEALAIMYNNLRTIYANFDSCCTKLMTLGDRSIVNVSLINEEFPEAIKGYDPKNRKIAINDKLKGITNLIRRIFESFPTYRDKLFKGYRKGPKIHWGVYEVDEFFSKIEPKI